MKLAKKLFLITIFISSYLLSFTHSQEFTEEKVLAKLTKLSHEKEAVKLLNECIYQNLEFKNLDVLRLMYGRKWLKATRLVLDYGNELNSPAIQNEIPIMIENLLNKIKNVKTFLKDKKKNIIRISPVFEWSQDHDDVKIRLKFAKNLESPGEKGIKNFKISCSRTHLKVQGYKQHDEYVIYYYRNVHLYDFIHPSICSAYKETEGTFIIRLKKNQSTLYWNSLDQPTDDHTSMYTWFDVFTTYDERVKYTEYRDFAQQNLLMSDVEDHVREKKEEKRIRREKIESIANYLKTKGYENKNYCNSPINENYCILVDMYDWNYWLS
jgi:hypothetical protein